MRVDRVLRRFLGVLENAPTDTTVKPAPPVDPEILDEAEYEPKPKLPFNEPPEFEDYKPRVVLSEEMKKKIEIDIEEVDEDFLPVHHDEL
jgi:heat shock protein 90kDa beta